MTNPYQSSEAKPQPVRMSDDAKMCLGSTVLSTTMLLYMVGIAHLCVQMSPSNAVALVVLSSLAYISGVILLCNYLDRKPNE